ncbi:PREDICTED: sucrose-phosphate synthase 1 [Camelina sativa]|uniref:Sucrose-phosphate synthase n=1 Tax=Camelina sativa TaxID=90675 RepID=A0ABM0T4R9_CAMSA|nr:PREDICTED: sucrose-phosphate synthase 1 [Camelina sativa]
MAGNDWVNSYLEAILDVGQGLEDARSSLLLRERGRFTPSRYFVEEVITGFDETDLHRSWVKAVATRSPQERNTRLENMCWRIWNLARQKKQHEEKEAQRLAKRRLERERGRREATADMSEEFSEGEKGDAITDISTLSESTKPRLPRINSAESMEIWASQQKGNKLYLVLISLHGLIRGENMELGRDSDTGGQVKYVVELARALGSMPGVYRVDLLTRQVSSPDVDYSYGEPTEMLTPRDSEDYSDERGESSGAYIVRIPFGPKDKYIPKELLWPHIAEFVDGAMNHIMQMSNVLGEQVGVGKPIWPAAIHGHYADAGDAAALLSGALNVPMLLTGHSLGRDKLEQLLRQGRLSKEEINSTYKIMRRIEGEELSLDVSEMVITSTRQEIDEQWRLYDGFDPILERKLRARMKRNVSCYGRFMPRMVKIPPGMEFNHIVPHGGDIEDTDGNEEHPTSPDPPIWAEIMRFFSNSRKPMILALARPDPKKNITTLVKAFGECRPLRELANLALIMGNRDGIDEMSSTSSSVLLSVLKLIDKYDLYGQVAYPKHHKQSDVPDIYRLAAKSKGVFINPAIIEPFGLTLIEAAAHGLPMVATQNGGPVDIHRVLDNGLLVDPHDQQSISAALLKLVADKHLWSKCRQNGLKNIHQFSWPEHCKTYLSRITSFKPRHPQWQSDDGGDNSEPESPSDSLRDIQDISLNLKFSFDGSGNDNYMNQEGSSMDRKSKIEAAVQNWSKGKDSRKMGSLERSEVNSGKFPAVRRRKFIVVIAIDFDGEQDTLEATRRILDAVEKERADGSVGFILSTSLTISEIQSFLVSGGLNPNDFDAFICNSGSDLHYTSLNNEDGPFVVDFYYHSHIEYRWGGEGLRKTLIRWASSLNDKKAEKDEQIVTLAEHLSTDYCYTFTVKKPAAVPPVRELRKLLRIQALRCHVVYSQNGTRINVIPVLASRIQALRYLFVRWGIDMAKMAVFVGESGDTDYEGLLGGLHKSVVLTGVSCSASNALHANRSYPLTDVISLESSNVVHAPADSDVRDALKKLELIKE